MKSEDDPEARIRELEQPLAETARVSETGATPPPGKWAPPSGPPIAPPPLPYSGSFGLSPATRSRNQTWWILAAVFVIGMIALPVGIMFFTAHQVSRSGLTTLLPTPGISTISPTPSGATTQTPAAGPSTSPAAVPTAPAGENLSVSGISENQTIACNNNNTVNINGVSNTVVITGHCASLSVSGVQNQVTVDAVDSIEASGFNNQITYHTGSPSVDKSGEGNVVQQG